MDDFKLIDIKKEEVKIGEVKIANDGESLVATLGSCVGIIFHWREKKMSGLAHCILPETTRDISEIGARYVTQGIPSLMKLMAISEDDIPNIEVWVTGGGLGKNSKSVSNLYHFGVQSLKVAQSTLQRMGFKVKTIEAGDEESREVNIDAASGAFVVKKFTKPA